jgi:hypothetical protein
MKHFPKLLLVIIIMTAFAGVVGTGAEAGAWQPVGEGIDYREYILPDPNRVYVARLDRSNLSASIETSIAEGRLVDGLETISSQAARYDQSLSWWGQTGFPHEQFSPGTRNQVVVAINGTFSLPPEYKQPWEGQVHSGWYMWRFKDSETRNAFVWKTDRSVFIGGCVRHPDSKQLLHYANASTHEIDGVNVPRSEEGQLILYSAQFDRDTHTDDTGIEVLVELSTPLLISHPEQIVGTVRTVQVNRGSTPIPFDHIVLSASGQDATRLQNNIAVGDQIGISQYVRNCDENSTHDWNNTFAAMVSNDFYFLEDGVFQYDSDPYAIYRHPRTAVAYNDDFVYFIVVDGRYEGVSLGMTMEELADFALNELDADHALNLDGGGSSTMVVNGQVVNFPSDGVPDEFIPDPLETLPASIAFGLQGVPLKTHSTKVAQVYLPLISISPEETDPDPDPTPRPDIVERAVPNGLMMVVVSPGSTSTSFQPGQAVIVNTSYSVNLRLGPGTNYAIREAIPGGTRGVIQAHDGSLNGVLAKDYYWWKVKFGSAEGWMAEKLLARQ